MNNPELYQEYNNLQKRDAFDLLEEYATKNKWKKFGGRIFDIGSGDGSVTNDLLKQYIPSDYQKLVGCDISDRMVKFANDKYGDERTNFIEFDIAKPLPQDLKSQFDLVFSSYTLHWVQQQVSAFQNIYDLLAEDGSCLLNILGQHPICQVIRTLAKTKKWTSWLINPERFVTPYQDSKFDQFIKRNFSNIHCLVVSGDSGLVYKHPDQEIKKIMEQIGFQNIESHCKRKTFVFNDAEVVRRAIKAVNGFDIPANLLDDYIEDFIQEFRRMGVMVEKDNLSVITTFNYDLVTVYANKTTTKC